MKKIIVGLFSMAVVALLTSAALGDKVMTKENGAYVVNTTTLGAGFTGYEGPTPLKVYIRKGKVEKIVALPNQETPRYWQAAWKHLQDKWNGLTVKEAKALKVDGRTGATYSSDAIKENVRLALEYYEKHK